MKGPMGRCLQPTYPLSLIDAAGPQSPAQVTHPQFSSLLQLSRASPAGSGPGVLCNPTLLAWPRGNRTRHCGKLKLPGGSRFGDSRNKVLQMPTLGLLSGQRDLRDHWPSPFANGETEAHSLNKAPFLRAQPWALFSFSASYKAPFSGGALSHNQLVSL